MFEVDNEDTKAMSIDVAGIFRCFIVKGTNSYKLDNLVVSSLTSQYNVPIFAHCKTI